MDLIDSHCHLDGFQKKGLLSGVLERAEAAHVSTLIAVGTAPKDWVLNREMSQSHPGRIHYTIGLHPGYVDTDWEDAVSQISTFFMPPHPPVALGEIGLDYFHLPKDPVTAGEALLQQEAAFAQQLSLASEFECPIIIHSRDAFDETVAMIDRSGVNWEQIVFHCFSYGPDEVRQINQRGGRASFTGIVTYKNAPAVREALKSQGPDRLMLETDCPYLSPEPHRGKGNEPAYVADIARRCAAELGISIESLANQTTANAKQFFDL